MQVLCHFYIEDLGVLEFWYSEGPGDDQPDIKGLLYFQNEGESIFFPLLSKVWGILKNMKTVLKNVTMPFC